MPPKPNPAPAVPVSTDDLPANLKSLQDAGHYTIPEKRETCNNYHFKCCYCSKSFWTTYKRAVGHLLGGEAASKSGACACPKSWRHINRSELQAAFDGTSQQTRQVSGSASEGAIDWSLLGLLADALNCMSFLIRCAAVVFRQKPRIRLLTTCWAPRSPEAGLVPMRKRRAAIRRKRLDILCCFYSFCCSDVWFRTSVLSQHHLM